MKKAINLFISIAMVFGAFFSAFIMAPPDAEAIDVSPDAEVLYLADSMDSNDGITRIYRVDLNATTTRADLTEILGSPIPLNQVDALAASATGDMLYAIDKDTSKLMSVKIDDGIHTEIGVVKVGASVIGGIVLAATAIDGDLYVASQTTNEVYVVDKTTAVAVSKGKIYNNGVTDINLSGADLVFASDGSMYVWTNAAKTNAPKGLYFVADPLTLPLEAAYLGIGTGNFFTGLAIRDNGAGDLVGSDTNIDSIVLISKTDADMSLNYPMYLDGSPYAYTFGDMTAGPIIHALEIEKTVNTTFTRTWEWEIDKTSTTPALDLAIGEVYPVNYEVTVSATHVDSDWTATGTISIHNPNILSATVEEVTDMVGVVAGDVVCPVEMPYILMPGADLLCEYELVLPNGQSATNTASVITSGLVPGNHAEMPVIFADPSLEVDEQASIEDDKFGALGDLMASSTPHVFEYSLNVGPYQSAGHYEFENIAMLVTNDTSATSSDNHIIEVHVAANVCTLTQGYWKTHSSYGPAPYDPAWELITPNNEDSDFFHSSQSYYQVLWTSPKGGNAYYQLAHQYIAAKLNVLNGASAPTIVSDAINSAETLFGNPAYTPSYIGSLKGNNSLRQQFLSLASILASYNEGLIGPGHCE